MNTNQIVGYLDCFLAKRSCTYAVIPCNLLKTIKIHKFPLYLVVNTARYPHPGEHWITLYQGWAGSPILFLDSYGFPLTHYDKMFQHFVKKNSHRLVEGKRRLQSFDTDVCGAYSVFFIYLLFRHSGELNRLYGNFSHDTYKNDSLVANFLFKRPCHLANKPSHCQSCKTFRNK